MGTCTQLKYDNLNIVTVLSIIDRYLPRQPRYTLKRMLPTKEDCSPPVREYLTQNSGFFYVNHSIGALKNTLYTSLQTEFFLFFSHTIILNDDDDSDEDILHNE